MVAWDSDWTLKFFPALWQVASATLLDSVSKKIQDGKGSNEGAQRDCSKLSGHRGEQQQVWVRPVRLICDNESPRT